MGMYDRWIAANPTASDKDSANVEFVLKALDMGGGSGTGQVYEGSGRDLRTVLGISTDDWNIPQIYAALVAFCNNGVSAANGAPNFSFLQIGDYIDGFDFSSLGATPAGGGAFQAWNDTTKNNRLVIAGFNTYKRAGATENAKNHIVFAFRNVLALGRINATATNTGGYWSSELNGWLQNAFINALSNLYSISTYPISKLHSIKGSSQWQTYPIWIPTEPEIFGWQTNVTGDELNYMNTNVHLPIFRDSFEYRVKRWNGNRQAYWMSTPSRSDTTDFTYVGSTGNAIDGCDASDDNNGVSPCFCIA